jgi:hypothetical protein
MGQQLQTCIVAWHHGSLKSPTYSCVSITLPSRIVNANHALVRVRLEPTLKLGGARLDEVRISALES